MLCKGCGAEITSNQVFCPHCGTKNEPAGNTQITKRCVNCGKGFTEDKAFCDNCGGNLVPLQPGHIPSMVIPNQVPINQMPSNQPPLGQIPNNQPYAGQIPTGMPASGQSAPRQMPPYQMPQGQVPPPRQMPSGPMPSGPMPSGPMPSGPMPSGPMPSGPILSGPMPSGPIPPNMMPPYMAAPMPPKKKSPLLPIFIVVGALVVIIIGVIGVTKFVSYLKSQKEQPVIEESADVVINDDEDVTPSVTPEDVIDDTDVEDVTTDDAAINYMYSYAEFPDAVSIDSYPDFSYFDYSYSDDVATYTYLYSNLGKTETDFYNAVSQYGDLLMNQSGFYYEDNFSSNLYYETGDVTDYYSRDDFAIGVTASVEEEGWYAYISIYDLRYVEDDTDTSTDTNTDTSTDTQDTTTFDPAQYEKYYYYIDQRELTPFNQYEEIYMDNGIAFYLNDIYVTDNGDGTASVECNMDLGATLDNCSLYIDDFMVMPKDASGNIIGDVTTLDSIVDSDGNSLTTPVLLDTDYFYNYNLYFTVPADTNSFTFYGANIELDETGEDAVASGNVYYIDIYLE